MRLFLAALLSAVSVATAGVVAQDKPNLSGKWVFDHDETAAEAKATQTTPMGAQRRVSEALWKNGNQGPDFTFTHEGKTLKFERTLPDGRFETVTYVLDGSETQHQKPDRVDGQPGSSWTSRSSWQDSTLQILSVEEGVRAGAVFTPGGGRGAVQSTPIKIERKQMLSLSPDGKLISEMSFKGSSGEWGPTARSIYKKG
jgi:hypothetical protein